MDKTVTDRDESGSTC